MNIIWSIYKFILRRLANIERWLLAVSLTLVIILGIAPSITSFFLKKIISTVEQLLTYKQSEALYGLLVLFCIAYILMVFVKELASICRSTLYHLLSIELTFDVQSLILNKIKKVPYKEFFTQNFQDLYTNVIKNCSTECFKLVTAATTLIIFTIDVVSATIILACFKIELAIFLFVFALPSVFIRCKTQNAFMSVYKENTKLERENFYIFNILTDKSYLKEIRLFNLEKYFEEKRNRNLKENLHKWKRFAKKEIKDVILSHIFPCFGVLISIGYVVYMTLLKNIDLSELVFYSGIIISFHTACGQCVLQLAETYKSMLFINQLFEFFYLEEKNSLNKSLPVITFHTIEFHNVSFKYPGASQNALHKINLKLNLGEKVCIVGENGCGKSTLINLLLRHYLPTEGYITLDNIDIQNFDLQEYRNLFSGIYQDFQKMAVPLNEFISFGNMEKVHDEKKLEIATQKTTINRLIKSLPEKFNSRLTQLFDSNGLELSGGQWQRLAVSRVFFSDAPILIFDEPTSALDSFTEAKVFDEIIKIKEKLVILISHRMYTLKYADNVVYMKEGAIIASGHHDELFEACNEYKKMFLAQYGK